MLRVLRHRAAGAGTLPRGAEGAHLLRAGDHRGKQRRGGALLRGHREGVRAAGRGELSRGEQLRRSGGSDRQAPALPRAGRSCHAGSNGLIFPQNEIYRELDGKELNTLYEQIYKQIETVKIQADN